MYEETLNYTIYFSTGSYKSQKGNNNCCMMDIDVNGTLQTSTKHMHATGNAKSESKQNGRLYMRQAENEVEIHCQIIADSITRVFLTVFYLPSVVFGKPYILDKTL
jgi:hypothetical protein